MSDFIFHAPKDREPTAVAVYAHGFGDTEAGPIGRALGKTLIKHDVALVSVPLVDNFGSDLVTIPYSEQSDRLTKAVETAQDKLPTVPCHIVSHSQGVFAASEVALDGPNRPAGLFVALAPPLTNPIERLEQRMQNDSIEIPTVLVAMGILGAMNTALSSEQRIFVTEEFWDEALALSPFQLVAAAYETGPTHIVLAGRDEVLGEQQQLIGRLPASPRSSLTTIENATHAFSHGDRARAVGKVVHFIQQQRLIAA